jgi:hypothetical protein
MRKERESNPHAKREQESRPALSSFAFYYAPDCGKEGIKSERWWRERQHKTVPTGENEDRYKK